LYNYDYQILFNSNGLTTVNSGNTQNPSGSNSLNVYNNIATVPITSGTARPCVLNYCEYSPLPYWNPVDGIVFVAQHLNMVPELIAKPVAISNSSKEIDQQNIGVNADSYYVLADFSTNITLGSDYHPSISFEPVAEFRLVELYGEEPIRSLNIQAYWKDKFGALHPLTLEAGGVAYIKILFRKKDFYKDEDEKE
jgi:hypothetical protein